MSSTMAEETTALKQSMAASAIMGLIGIAFAVSSGSDAVLLDGAYSLLSFGMAWVATRLTPRLEAPGSDSFPFGQSALEPVFNLVRAGVVLVVLAFAALSALGALSAGGASTRAGPAVVYGLVVGAAGLAVARRQEQLARQLNSSLLRVDAASFRADGAISMSVGIAFLISAVVGWSGGEAILPYIDPIVVLLLVAVLVREPYATLRGAAGELLVEAPPRCLREDVEAAIDEALADTTLEARQIRVWKLGRRLDVRVAILVAEADATLSVRDLDALRSRVHAGLEPLAAVVDVDVLFTASQQWLDGSPPAQRLGDGA